MVISQIFFGHEKPVVIPKCFGPQCEGQFFVFITLLTSFICNIRELDDSFRDEGSSENPGEGEQYYFLVIILPPGWDGVNLSVKIWGYWHSTTGPPAHWQYIPQSLPMQQASIINGIFWIILTKPLNKAYVFSIHFAKYYVKSIHFRMMSSFFRVFCRISVLAPYFLISDCTVIFDMGVLLT